MYSNKIEMLTIDGIYIYLRKSRSDDPALTVEEVLEKHEMRLQEWAQANFGAKIPEENILREVVSGETIDDRPEMLRLLSMIESPKVQAILIVEPQRLSRGDLEDAGRIIKFFRYSNTLICTPHDNFDMRDDRDREYFERELKRGNEYLEYQKQIMRAGRELSVKQGNFIGSIAPYGYKKIVVMGSTMANIHNLNIVNNLPCSYSKIDINLDNYLNKVKKYDIDQYNLVLKNKLKLMKLINEVNDSLRKIKKNKLCISHNDYKYLNMLWNKNDLYLLDFDACGMSLPSVALVEAAYALSLNHNQLDLRHYKLFLKSYLSIRNINEEEYDLGIKMAMNGKLQWLNYMISKTLKRRDSDMDEGIRYMINELVTFQNNKLKMMNAYLSRK